MGVKDSNKHWYNEKKGFGFIASEIDESALHRRIHREIDNSLMKSINKSQSEIIKNAKLLKQAKRTSNFFFMLPNEILTKIVVQTKTSDLHLDKDAEKLAMEYLSPGPQG